MFQSGITPKTGYMSEAKQEYRDRVWASIAKKYVAGTWALIMPARGVEEIETAMRHGIRSEDIFCFDASAAVIATSIWRKKYPDIKFAASSLDGLAGKLAKYGRHVSVANFDFCGNVAGESVDQFDEFFKSGIMSRRGAFAVNIAKGREGRTLLKLLNKTRKIRWADCDRIAAFAALSDVFGPFEYRIAGLDQGQYRENKTPMTWAAFSYREAKNAYDLGIGLESIRKAFKLDNAGEFARVLHRMYQHAAALEGGSVNLGLSLNRPSPGDILERRISWEFRRDKDWYDRVGYELKSLRSPTTEQRAKK